MPRSLPLVITIILNGLGFGTYRNWLLIARYYTMVEIVDRVTVTISRKWLSETNNLDFDYNEFRKKLNVENNVFYSRKGENQHVLSGSYDDIKIIKEALEKELNELQLERKKDLSKNQVQNDVTISNGDIVNRPDNEKQGNAAVKTKELHSNEDGKHLQANTTNDATAGNSKSEIPITPKSEHKNRKEEFDQWMDRQNAKIAGPKVDAKEVLPFQPTLQDNLVTSENNSNPQGAILENSKQAETSSTFLIKHDKDIDVIEAGLQVSVEQTKANIVWLKDDRMCIATGSLNEVEKVGKIFMDTFGDCLYFPDSESNQKYRNGSNPIKENVSETSSTFFIKHDVDMNTLESGLQAAVGQTKVNITWCKEDRMCVVIGLPNEVQKVEMIFKESFGDCLLAGGSPARVHDNKPFSYKANAGSKNQTITTIEHNSNQTTPTTPNPNLKTIPMPVIPFVITIDTRTKLEFKSTGMNLTVHVYKSDIVKQVTDMIVNSTDCYLMNKERLSRAILQAAGPGVETECQSLRAQYGSIPQGKSTFTSAGNLRPTIQHIIHAIGPDHEQARRNKQQAHTCLLEMYKYCLFVTLPLIPTPNRTISVPPVGSRLIGTTDAVRAAFEAIQSFTEQWSKVPRYQRTTLTDIHFVSIDQTEIEDSIVTFRSLIKV